MRMMQNHQTFEVAAPAPAAPAPPPAPQPEALAPPPVPQAAPVGHIKEEDVDMDSVAGSEEQGSASVPNSRLPFFKTKLGGVKKISNKERRRRQNAMLRRLTTPKNALMCINEMLPNEQIASQFKVELAPNDSLYYTHGSHNFCAELALDGVTYKGYGENKLSARNAAAEQAIRDIVLKKMERYSEVLGAAAGAGAGAAAVGAGAAGQEEAGEAAAEEAGEAGEAEGEALPMIQLLSFALHKLFAEWEGAGHRVPQLRPVKVERPQSSAEEEPPRPPPAPSAARERKVPDNAAAMHPAMLLTVLRPHACYREIASEGDKPQNMLFTVGVEVDGQAFIGKATSKKEARKSAARAACKAILGITFEDEK